MTDPDDFVLPTFCPFCGRENDRHESVKEPAVPKTGDFGICWGCGKVFVFDTLKVRRPTPEEQAEIDANPDVTLARGVMRESYVPTQAAAFTRRVLAEEEGNDP